LNAADGFSVDMPRNSEQLSGTTATKFHVKPIFCMVNSLFLSFSNSFLE
jgi:hypothetical protein